MTEEYVSGVASGSLPKMLIRVATVYDTVFKVLAEYLQNSADEPQTSKIWLILDKSNDRIILGDNGPGMGGRLPADDLSLVGFYKELEHRSEDPGCDLRSVVSDEGAHTLEWLIQNIANSIKGTSTEYESKDMNSELRKLLKATGRQQRKKKKGNTIGQFGIGIWAFLSMAEQMVIRSKANPKLAAELNQKPVPYYLLAPTRSALERSNLKYDLGRDLEDFVDPWENELEHGTIITLNGLRREAWEELTIKELLPYLRDMFGTMLETRELQIWVADLSTGEPAVRVEPQIPLGTVLYNDSFQSRDGTQCHAMIYYNQKARGGNVVRVTKLGVTICPLTSIKFGNQQVFNSPWDGGQLGGYISYEHFNEGDKDNFDSSKHSIVDNADLRWWVKKVREIEAVIRKGIEEVERDAQNDRMESALRLLNSAVKTAMDDLGINFNMPHDESGFRAPRERANQRRLLEDIVVVVLDRNGRPVPHVMVHIKGPQKTWDLQTGNGGTNTLRRPIPGKYVVWIDEPDLLDPKQSPQEFKIDHQAEVFGKRIKFILNRGNPDQDSKMPNIQVSYNNWEDSGEPWRQFLTTIRVVEFNINQNTRLRDLLEWEHTREADTLMIEYTVAAINEALKESGDHISRIRQSSMFTEIFLRMQEARATDPAYKAAKRRTKV